MYRSKTVRELQRFHRQELERRDEMIQSLLDRLQHPDRVPIWRERLDESAAERRANEENWIANLDAFVTDPDQLSTYDD